MSSDTLDVIFKFSEWPRIIFKGSYPSLFSNNRGLKSNLTSNSRSVTKLRAHGPQLYWPISSFRPRAIALKNLFFSGHVMAVESSGRKLRLTKCECELLWMWFDVRRRLFSKIFWRINSSFCWACNRCCCKYIDECCCSWCCLMRWNWLIAGLIAGFGNWDEFQSNGFIRMFCSVKSFRWFWLRSKTKMKN